MSKLKIILLIAIIKLHGMELLISEQNSESSQLFLGYWENNTPYTIDFNICRTDIDVIKNLSPDIFEKKIESPTDQNNPRFLNIDVTPIKDSLNREFQVNIICRVKKNLFTYIQQISTTLLPQIFLNINQKKDGRTYVKNGYLYNEQVSFELKKSFSKNLKIFINGKVNGCNLQQKVWCTCKILNNAPLKLLSIKAIIKNKLPINNLPDDIKEAVAAFKQMQINEFVLLK